MQNGTAKRIINTNTPVENDTRSKPIIISKSTQKSYYRVPKDRPRDSSGQPISIMEWLRVECKALHDIIIEDLGLREIDSEDEEDIEDLDDFDEPTQHQP